MKEILLNKLALITGGSSGIGLALAKELAKQGMRIAIIARRIEQLQKAKTQIGEFTNKGVYIVQADVSKWEEIEEKITTFMDEVGTPDLLINCAGVVRPGLFEELDVDIFHWMIDINLMGPIHLSKVVVPRMLERGSGHVVNVSSVAGFIGTFGYSAYGASKFGLRGFTDVLRSEMKSRGIDVSIVFPPDTDTPQLKGEESYKPAVTRILSATASVQSAADVAVAIRKGIERKKYMIIPGFESKAIYFLNNLPFKLGYHVMDWMVADAQKKIEKEK